MPIQLKVNGDPRRPAEARNYQRPKMSADEQPADMFLLMALALGLVALVFKAKLPAWGSLVLCVLSLANGKAGQTDIKQYVTSFTFALFGLVSGYLVPARQRGAAGGGGGPSAT